MLAVSLISIWKEDAMLISEIAKAFSLDVIANGHDINAVDIRSVAAIDKAGEGQISFFTNNDYAHLLGGLKASALLVKEHQPNFPGVQLVHKDPQFIFAKIALQFYHVDHGPVGVQAGAFVHETAKLGKDVRIHPGARIDADVELGDRVVIYPGAVIGKGVKIGADTVVYANAVIYYAGIIGERCIIHAGSVIGADGFGFAVSGGEICKIPQTGRVRIGNNVEVGALCTIDRAASGETVIGDNCKFDDRVHIGHNCEIGENTMLSASVGIAGSTKVGRWNLMGGQA